MRAASIAWRTCNRLSHAKFSSDGTIRQYADAIRFNYPALAECYKVAALDASNRLRG
jgi:hypothetical protein